MPRIRMFKCVQCESRVLPPGQKVNPDLPEWIVALYAGVRVDGRWVVCMKHAKSWVKPQQSANDFPTKQFESALHFAANAEIVQDDSHQAAWDQFYQPDVYMARRTNGYRPKPKVYGRSPVAKRSPVISAEMLALVDKMLAERGIVV